MLYAKALREGIDELPQTSPEIRLEVNAEGRAIGWPAMHEKLAQVDPAAAARLAPNDSQRIARAIEVFRMTGKTLSSLQAGARQPDPSLLTYGLVPADRAALHARIGERFEEMVRNGFLDEVRALMGSAAFDPESPAMRCVGYRQAILHLRGEYGYEEFLERGKAATRQLAKRQMTWLRSMQGVAVIDPLQSGEELLRRLAQDAERILSQLPD
jgi:tRNA dimethylallyltransferase